MIGQEARRQNSEMGWEQWILVPRGSRIVGVGQQETVS